MKKKIIIIISIILIFVISAITYYKFILIANRGKLNEVVSISDIDQKYSDIIKEYGEANEISYYTVNEIDIMLDITYNDYQFFGYTVKKQYVLDQNIANIVDSHVNPNNSKIKEIRYIFGDITFDEVDKMIRRVFNQWNNIDNESNSNFISKKYQIGEYTYQLTNEFEDVMLIVTK